METDAVEVTERSSCFTLFRKFLKEAKLLLLCLSDVFLVMFLFQVLERLKQYKDDLQASCLLLILSAPKEFIETDINSIVSAVQVLQLPCMTASISSLQICNRSRWTWV